MIPTKDTTMEESERAYVKALTPTASARYLDNLKTLGRRPLDHLSEFFNQ